LGEAAIDLSTLVDGTEFAEFVVDGGGESAVLCRYGDSTSCGTRNITRQFGRGATEGASSEAPAEDDILSGGVPVSEFAATVSGWQPLSVVDSVFRDQQIWQVHEEDIPRLRLAVQLVMAARQTTLFDILDTMPLTEDQPVFTAFHQLVAFLINSVVRPN